MATIKAEILRSDIASAGFKQADLARILNINPHTLSSRISQNVLDDSILESLAIILRQPKDKYIYMATKEEPQEEGGISTKDAPYAESLHTIADGFVSLIRRVEEIQKNVERLSDEVSTMKDTTDQSAEAQKRFNTDFSTFKRNAESWLKNFEATR